MTKPHIQYGRGSAVPAPTGAVDKQPRPASAAYIYIRACLLKTATQRDFMGWKAFKDVSKF